MPSREQFYREAYQQAREAGLNDAQARLAASQASLETGFGRSVVGNNYFGIKAGSSWQGPAVEAGTWEDEGGQAVKQNARFRSYENPVQSFRDWASTLGRKWGDALNAPTFGEAVEGLRYGQAGGYATDRKYGSKLRSIDRRYRPQIEETDGIMQAINPPTPEARPEPGLLSYTPSPVERRELPPADGLLGQPTPSASALSSVQGPSWENPFASITPQEATPSMSPAEQYASYGAGKNTSRMAGLLSQDVAYQRSKDALRPALQAGLLADDVAYQRSMDGLAEGVRAQQAVEADNLSQDVAYQRMIDGLNAQKQQLQAGINPMDTAEPWKQPGVLAQPAVTQPAVEPQGVMPVEQPQPVSYEQTASVPGLLSPQEQQMYDAQRLSLANAPVNRRAQFGNAAKGLLGTVGGGLLGGLLAGPLGAAAGGLLGKSFVTPGGIGNRSFPKKPDSNPRGDGRETDYGRSVRESSRQYDRAVKTGSVGLY